MNLEEFREQLDADEKNRREMLFIIRWILNFVDYMWYRIILNIPELPYKVKMFLQKVFRGYCDNDIYNLNWFILKKIYKPFKKFYKYQCEHGHSLPIEFSTDPAGWLVVLSKIEYALDHYYNEEENFDFDSFTKMTEEERSKENEKVKEGMELLGRYLIDLWD